MPLTIDDIQLLASERMTDLADGGGRVTGTVIQDGVENNVFPDVSSDDRASGRVRIRKIYSAIRNADDEPLLGARVAITRGPTDPAISVALFSPGSWEDERADAVDYLERSYAAGTYSGAQLHPADEAGAYFPWAKGLPVNAGDTVLRLLYDDGTSAPPTPPTDYHISHGGQSAVIRVVEVLEQFTEAAPPNRSAYNVRLSQPMPFSISSATAIGLNTVSRPGGPNRVYSISAVTAALTGGASNVVTVADTTARLIPLVLGATDQQIIDLYGLDPLAFPVDGRVSFCEIGTRAMVHHTDEYTVANPAVAEATYDVGRTNLAWLRVFDQLDVAIPTDRYTADLAAGTITMAAGLDLSGYTQPLIIRHTIIDEADITAVDHGANTVTLAANVTRSYPSSGAYLSTVLRHGDMFARTTVPFAQGAWTGVWSDSLIGSAPAAQYDHTLHPIVVTNDGALKQRWRINFTSSTDFQLIGETVGVIAVGDVNTLFAPLNPRTSQPYMTIPAAGWGTGWQPGNQLRINTEPADYPLYALQCVTPSAPNGTPDEFWVEQIGDIDA